MNMTTLPDREKMLRQAYELPLDELDVSNWHLRTCVLFGCSLEHNNRLEFFLSRFIVRSKRPLNLPSTRFPEPVQIGP